MKRKDKQGKVSNGESENKSWDLFFFHENFAAGRSAISSRLRSLSNDHFSIHDDHDDDDDDDGQ